jgi:hypothetical protein
MASGGYTALYGFEYQYYVTVLIALLRIKEVIVHGGNSPYPVRLGRVGSRVGAGRPSLAASQAWVR